MSPAGNTVVILEALGLCRRRRGPTTSLHGLAGAGAGEGNTVRPHVDPVTLRAWTHAAQYNLCGIEARSCRTLDLSRYRPIRPRSSMRTVPPARRPSLSPGPATRPTAARTAALPPACQRAARAAAPSRPRPGRERRAALFTGLGPPSVRHACRP
eukprot:scaffold1410_cov386-Prasinococcus_capsulatus_cf.AAC.12